MIRLSTALVLFLGAIALNGREACASVMYYTSQSAFNAQGTIMSTLNLDSFGSSGGYINGQYGDLIFNSSTYVEGANGTTYAPSRDVAVSIYLQNLVVGVDTTTTQYNMLSVDAGFYYGAAVSGGTATFYITTNLNSYGFSVTIPTATGPLAFEGFIADPGEYITSFDGYHYPSENNPGGVGATDFSLGVAGVVPEPGSLTLVSIAGGLALLGGALRRRHADRR